MSPRIEIGKLRRPAGLALIVLASSAAVQSAAAANAAPTNAATGAGVASSHFQLEVLSGMGIVVLFLALAFGAWRYHTRNRANDKVTEDATRELYQNPDGYQAKDFEKRLRP
jgi:protein-S-isoprenylcysteine O-methyltransferase Ste14